MFSTRRTIASGISLFDESMTKKDCDAFHTNYSTNSLLPSDGNIISGNKIATSQSEFSQTEPKLNVNPSIDVKLQPIAASTSSISASVVASNSVQTYRIGQAFMTLKDSIISRGMQYSANTLASRRGYVAENFVAESYNVDATIKKIDDYAYVPGSTEGASPDIVYDHAQQEASLKFYKDASSSAKAQLNPQYGDQNRIIPADQVADGKQSLLEKAFYNEAKQKYGDAQNQRNVAERLNSTIKGSEGAESTPLSLKQSDKIAKAFSTDESGNKIYDEAKLDEAIADTGLTKRVNTAKVINELRGIGIAAAIGFGTGLTIGVLVSLAQNGLNPESIKYAFVDGAKQGGTAALMSIGGAAIGLASHNIVNTLHDVIMDKLDIIPRLHGITGVAENVYAICKMGIVGGLTIIAFSVYSFVKFKQYGYSTEESLLRTGKTAALSLSILLLSIYAQWVFGGPAGIIVSVVSGIVMTGYTLAKIQMSKETAKQLSYYTIELCRPSFAA